MQYIINNSSKALKIETLEIKIQGFILNKNFGLG